MSSSSENGDIERLVRQLDADTADAAMDAQAELTHRGHTSDVVAPLLRALPTLTRYGQLCAIEIVEELDDQRADEPLITLLDSEHDTVREWAAGALGRRQVHDAIPALRRSYQASLARHDRPDWSEPVGLRRALTDLGARNPVVPWLTASLQETIVDAWPAWPSTRIIDVLDDLANHGQVTLYFQLWRVEPDGQTYWVELPTDDTMLDFTQPWPHVVAHARNRAVNQARQAQLGEHIVAAIEWIDERDLAIAPDSPAGNVQST
ncbi:HEAT repeat domain-containing protein [Amycolatopsis sp. cmx-4-54]|uniref:HEAT repeat domain-containing protein n=1 Tax=Amycolatopsis sp. cmx-4-54 TaxID=2790936 RepID=UPI00397AF91A